MVKAVIVRVVFDSRKAKCEGKCGPDWSSTETIKTARQRINERFGKGITLEFLDLASAGKSSADWKKRLASENLNLPLLTINDKVRIPGEFDIRQMLDAIEAEREIYGKEL